MSEIDFIKWMVGYADGFEMVEGRIKTPHKHQLLMDTIQVHKGYYPLLLQRAIEGVSKSKSKYYIDQFSESICVGTSRFFCYIFEKDNGENIDQAKEQALKYIYEQGER